MYKIKNFNISYVLFVVLYSTLIVALNYKFLNFCILNMDAKNRFFDAFFLILSSFVILNFLFGIIFLIPYIRKFLAISLLLITSICSYFMIFLGIILDKGVMKSMIDATGGETLEVINLKLILWIFFTGILPSIFIIFMRIKRVNFKKELILRGSFLLACIGLIIILWMILSKEYFAFFRMNKDARYYPNPFYPISSFVKVIKKEYFSKKLPFKIIGDDAKIADNRKKLLIIVLGETARSMNYSANGYTKNLTNPYTKDFISLSDVTSCATFTAHSLPCMFSNLTRQKFNIDKANHQSNLLDILQMAGVKISWIDNDTGCKGVCKRIKDYNLNLKRDTDEWSLKEAKKIIDNLKEFNNELIVVHIVGSHGPTYYKRYPKEFDKFKPTCDTSELEKCTKEEITNTYDNTILFTDYIVEELRKDILKFQKDNIDLGVIYLSDHGESLGEGGIYLHGIPYSIAPIYQKKVPFMIWVNDKTKMDRLKKIRNDEFSHDNFFHTILSFFNIKSSVYDKNLDIFSKG